MSEHPDLQAVKRAHKADSWEAKKKACVSAGGEPDITSRQCTIDGKNKDIQLLSNGKYEFRDPKHNKVSGQIKASVPDDSQNNITRNLIKERLKHIEQMPIDEAMKFKYKCQALGGVEIKSDEDPADTTSLFNPLNYLKAIFSKKEREKMEKEFDRLADGEIGTTIIKGPKGTFSCKVSVNAKKEVEELVTGTAAVAADGVARLIAPPAPPKPE
jgi:hypothetical protein